LVSLRKSTLRTQRVIAAALLASAVTFLIVGSALWRHGAMAERPMEGPTLAPAGGSNGAHAVPGDAAMAAAGGDRARLGHPRADLTPEELAAFYAGEKLFAQPLPKLGPLYNDESCASCHSIPTLGGSGTIEHAAYMGPNENGKITLYRRHALAGWTIPVRPKNASRRVAPALYGLGLIEQIPDKTIRAACGQGHPDSAKQQGSLPRNAVARFGVKPFLGTVTDFVGAALQAESSVTNAVEGVGPDTSDDDAFPDPEVDAAFVQSLAAFVRGLQPPGRNGTDPVGEAAFGGFGCATCHVPDMPPAKDVFSDFCVHRMGEALADGILDSDAKGDEFRTAPLQGLRFRKIYMHDGRATTLDDAIIAHAGDAQASVDAYRTASADRRAALLRFLDTL
jgi:CxxC motif-containing protein (DUF1111 family)